MSSCFFVALNFNFCPPVVVRLFVAIAHLLEQRTDIVYNWPCVPGSIPGGTTVKKAVTQTSSCFFCCLKL